MSTLTDSEWLTVSEIILTINTTGYDKMRMSFLKKLEKAVLFDCATFYIGFNDKNEKELVNPIAYKHPFQRVGNPNDLYREFEKIKKSDYANSLYWLPSSTVIRDSDLLPDSIRVNTETYKRIYSRTGMHNVCHITLIYDNIFLGIASLYREKGHPDFTDKDLFVLKYIEPHLTHRMYQLHSQGRSQVSVNDNMCKEYHLTQREIEIIPLICKGLSNKEIGQQLFVSEDTIKKHIQHIFSKMNVKSRSQLIRKWTDEDFKLSTFDNGGLIEKKQNPNFDNTPSI